MFDLLLFSYLPSISVFARTFPAGAHPFDLEGEANNEEIEGKIIRGEKPPLRDFEYARHLSWDAIHLIEGLMEVDPNKRLTAEQVLENKWVLGETPSSKKIEDSDRRLACYRKHKTKIGSTLFKALLSQTDAVHQETNRKVNQEVSGSSSSSNDHDELATEHVSIVESAFRRLDTQNKGYLSTKDMNGGETKFDTNLSLSDVSFLLTSENMKNKYFSKGQVVYEEGDAGDSMYLINSGSVEVTTKDGFKKLRKQGEIFGEDVMLTDGPILNKNNRRSHGSTVRCVTPVHVLEIPRDLFDKYVASDKETFLSMAETDRHRKRERANAILRLNDGGRGEVYKKGDVIFREGQKGDKLYWLEEGDVDITTHGHKVRSLKLGEMTGEHAAYYSHDNKPYNVTATCLSDKCKIKSLTSKAMRALFRNDPALHRDFRDLMLRRDFKKAVCHEIGRPFPTTEAEIEAAFTAIDTDKSGDIAFGKLRTFVRRFDPNYKDSDIKDMLASLDLDKSGSLTWDAFRRIFAMDKEA